MSARRRFRSSRVFAVVFGATKDAQKATLHSNRVAAVFGIGPRLSAWSKWLKRFSHCVSEAGESNVLAERLLYYFRKLRGSKAPGEPKQARAFLDDRR